MVGEEEDITADGSFFIFFLAKPIVCSIVWTASQDEAASNSVKERIMILSERLESKIGDSKDEIKKCSAIGNVFQDQDNYVFFNNNNNIDDDDIDDAIDADDQIEIKSKYADNYNPETSDTYSEILVLFPNCG